MLIHKCVLKSKGNVNDDGHERMKDSKVRVDNA
jgi:hypothetical protein